MKAVFQRVTEASVTVDNQIIGQIGKGAMLLIGVTPEDTEETAALLAKKIAELRVFTDENDKMNLSLLDVHGSALAVSQFTLCANLSHGRRPDFFGAAPYKVAQPLFDSFCKSLAGFGIPVQTGEFGADMQVKLVNDGPVTILMDTDIWQKGSKG